MRRWVWVLLLALALLACEEAEPEPGRLPQAPCPARMAYVSFAHVCIDRFEARVVNGRAEPADGELPESAISWEDADEACRAAGHRLCTLAEWRGACAGAEGRAYPYGAEYEPERCNTSEWDSPRDERRVRPGGSRPRCATPEGVLDLSGNVLEWQSDDHPSGVLRPLSGGGFSVDGPEVRCERSIQLWQPPDAAFEGYGFRCCADRARAR